MIVIGLTGGSGSGKSTVAQLLMKYGAKWINTDVVYHGLIERSSPCAQALSKKFGRNILADDGSVNRKALAKIVFAPTPEGEVARRDLNAITHTFVRTACETMLDEYAARNTLAVVLDVPLLFESGFDAMCDTTVAVLAPRKQRVARIVQRDGISIEEAEARIQAQKNDTFYREHATYVIENDGDTEHLQAIVAHLAHTLLTKV